MLELPYSTGQTTWPFSRDFKNKQAPTNTNQTKVEGERREGELGIPEKKHGKNKYWRHLLKKREREKKGGEGRYKLESEKCGSSIMFE